MKKLIVIILLITTSSIYSQQNWNKNWEKFTFRETPKLGETMAIFGVGFMGVGAISAFGKDNKANIVSGIFGMTLCISGVYIEINRDVTKYKYKRKIKLFANYQKIGLQIHI